MDERRSPLGIYAETFFVCAIKQRNAENMREHYCESHVTMAIMTPAMIVFACPDHASWVSSEVRDPGVVDPVWIPLAAL